VKACWRSRNFRAVVILCMTIPADIMWSKPLIRSTIISSVRTDRKFKISTPDRNLHFTTFPIVLLFELPGQGSVHLYLILAPLAMKMNLNGVQATQNSRDFTARSSFPSISGWRWVSNSTIAYCVDRNGWTFPYRFHSKAHPRFSISSASRVINA
jgi:hypothetical protein